MYVFVILLFFTTTTCPEPLCIYYRTNTGAFFGNILQFLLQHHYNVTPAINVQKYSVITTSHQWLTHKSSAQPGPWLLSSSNSTTIPHQPLTEVSFQTGFSAFLLLHQCVCSVSKSLLLSNSSEILGLLIYYLTTISILITK